MSVETPVAKKPRGGRKAAPAAAPADPATPRTDPDAELYTAVIALSAWALLTDAQREDLRTRAIVAVRDDGRMPPARRDLIWLETDRGMELAKAIRRAALERLIAAGAEVVPGAPDLIAGRPLVDPPAPPRPGTTVFIPLMSLAALTPSQRGALDQLGATAARMALGPGATVPDPLWVRSTDPELPNDVNLAVPLTDEAVAWIFEQGEAQGFPLDARLHLVPTAAAPANDTTPPPEPAAAPAPAAWSGGYVPSTQAREVPLADIDPSPTNPRKHFDQAELEELATDLKVRGLLQAVLVRPKPGVAGRFELVFGERRYRAAQRAGWTTIPATIRSLSDVEVLETQLIENAKRADVHPLEEADALAELHTKHAIPLEDLAARIGRPVAHVRARLLLRALGPEARAAFADGAISLGVAQLLARVPDAALQREALGDVTRTDWTGERMSVGRAAEHIAQRYMLRLDGAPFDLADATLVPAAGACTTCKHRTGNQPELFGDVKSKDTCTNPPCFAGKRDALWQLRTAKAKAEGATVIPAKQTKDLFPYGGGELRSDKYVDLTAKCYDDPKHRTYAQLLKKDRPPVALARDPHGGIHELVATTDLGKALKANGHDFKRAPARGDLSPAESRAARERRDREARERTVLRAALEQLVAGAGRREPTDAFWRVLARGMLEGIWSDTAKKIAARRGLGAEPAAGGTPPKGKRGRARQSPTELLAAAVGELAGGELRGLVLELAVARYASGDPTAGGPYHLNEGKEPSAFAQACALFKIDLKTLDARAKAVAAEAKQTKGTAAKKKGGAA